MQTCSQSPWVGLHTRSWRAFNMRKSPVCETMHRRSAKGNFILHVPLMTAISILRFIDQLDEELDGGVCSPSKEEIELWEKSNRDHILKFGKKYQCSGCGYTYYYDTKTHESL